MQSKFDPQKLSHRLCAATRQFQLLAQTRWRKDVFFLKDFNVWVRHIWVYTLKNGKNCNNLLSLTGFGFVRWRTRFTNGRSSAYVSITETMLNYKECTLLKTDYIITVATGVISELKRDVQFLFYFFISAVFTLEIISLISATLIYWKKIHFSVSIIGELKFSLVMGCTCIIVTIAVIFYMGLYPTVLTVRRLVC